MYNRSETSYSALCKQQTLVTTAIITSSAPNVSYSLTNTYILYWIKPTRTYTCTTSDDSAVSIRAGRHVQLRGGRRPTLLHAIRPTWCVPELTATTSCNSDGSDKPHRACPNKLTQMLYQLSWKTVHDRSMIKWTIVAQQIGQHRPLPALDRCCLSHCNSQAVYNTIATSVSICDN